MIVCKEYEARISALIDDELTAAERLEVLEHIAACPACKAFWEELLALRDVLREECSAPAGFADAVMARVQKTAQDPVAEERKVVRFPGWKRFAGLAACCAVVALGVWMADSIQPDSMTTSSVRNSYGAPEMAADDERMVDECEDLDILADNSGVYSHAGAADNSVLCEEPSTTSDDAGFCEPEDVGFVAAVTVSGEVVAQWVVDELDMEWIHGASYSLSEEQYNELCRFLRESGEKVNEIMGNENGSGYLLLTE